MSPNAIGRDFSSTREFLSLGALRALGRHPDNYSEKPPDGYARSNKTKNMVVSIMRRVVRAIYSVPVSACASCPSMDSVYDHHKDPSSLGSRVTGTLFGYRRGRVNFAVQEDPRSNPVMLLELATLTNSLVKEMASGLVRIALECERTVNREKLLQEPRWIMYCNGRKAGYALRRSWSDSDLRILTMVQAVSMGAGVLPVGEELGPEGELMYMRASFDRVVGSTDSEALYMVNPDGIGGPELSIFFLRI